MSYQIDQRKVIGVVTECNNVIKTHQFNHGEVLVGLSELLGRIIVDASKHHLQADQMYQLVQRQIIETIKVGGEASGKFRTEILE
jgi:hypothetical protein